MMGSQKDCMERGGAREMDGQRASKIIFWSNKERNENMSIHIVVLYFLVVPPTVLNWNA